MYNKPKYLFFFFTFLSFLGFTQTKYSNEFLKIGAGAKSLSMSKVCGPQILLIGTLLLR